MVMKKGSRAGNAPIKMGLSVDKNYFWCSCGLSKNQPFCDGSHQTSDFTPKSFKVEQEQDYFLCACKQTNTPPFCDGSHNK